MTPDFLLAAGVLVVAGMVALSIELPRMDADAAHKSLTDVFVAHERHQAARRLADQKRAELATAEQEAANAGTAKATLLTQHIDAVTKAVA